jgi:hypothetical protein
MRPLTTLDRRALLKALSLAPSHAVRVPPAVEAELRAAGLISSQVCLVAAAAGEPGPAPALLRDDLAGGLNGLPMDLRLQVVTEDGAPLPGTRVDVWHQGGGSLLSGCQVADARGTVRFRTIFPDAAPALINLRLHLITGAVAGATLAFDPVLSREIHASHDGYTASAESAAAPLAGPVTPIAPRMTAPDGGMEVALVVGISRQGQTSGLIERILRSA